MTRNLLRRSLATLAATVAVPALAHEGHGLSGPHWHATDAAIFIALAVAVGIALWAGRK
ncbi:hypothetical protein [Xenophilus sp. Marseille-Q4582]|uniref:hypothetical protein n=1 Tax=Xenophilus sp. Marseille-Q4582 TaxID=2866600 RepID=UPI001CE422DF|nr:hypothetical protein [Xenophilus sp. Marseille-Q4582]